MTGWYLIDGMPSSGAELGCLEGTQSKGAVNELDAPAELLRILPPGTLLLFFVDSPYEKNRKLLPGCQGAYLGDCRVS